MSPHAEDNSLRIAIAGVGRMGLAVARGLLYRDAHIAIDLYEPTPSDDVRTLVRDAVRLNPDKAPADILVLAVKPQVFRQVAPDLRPLLGQDALVVSIMAGISIASIREALGATHVIRAMPNLPGSIGAGISGFAASPDMPEAHQRRAHMVLQSLGAVVGPLPEDKLPLVTGVSGSGPAYVFALTEALAAGGVAAGLDADTAGRLARQTVIGAAELLKSHPETAPADFRAAVTSPGGTTQAALDVLMQPGALPSLMQQTVAAAVRRDRELGRDPGGPDASEDKTD